MTNLDETALAALSPVVLRARADEVMVHAGITADPITRENASLLRALAKERDALTAARRALAIQSAGMVAWLNEEATQDHQINQDRMDRLLTIDGQVVLDNLKAKATAERDAVVAAVAAVVESMGNPNRITGTMPGVRLQVERQWRDRLRAVLSDPAAASAAHDADTAATARREALQEARQFFLAIDMPIPADHIDQMLWSLQGDAQDRARAAALRDGGA